MECICSKAVAVPPCYRRHSILDLCVIHPWLVYSTSHRYHGLRGVCQPSHSWKLFPITSFLAFDLFSSPSIPLSSISSPMAKISIFRESDLQYGCVRNLESCWRSNRGRKRYEGMTATLSKFCPGFYFVWQHWNTIFHMYSCKLRAFNTKLH